MIWSDQLQLLERTGRVPALGSVVGVDARVRKIVVAVAPEVTDDTRGTPADEEADGQDHGIAAPETTTRTELVVNGLWTCDLDDDGRRVLPLLRVPRRRCGEMPS